MIRRFLSILCLFILLVGCVSGTATADSDYSPSTGEILHGLYGGEHGLTEEETELMEDSVYFREGLCDVSLKERLVTLIEVYKDERIIDYFAEAMERRVCSGFGVNNLGYFSILVYSSATNEDIEALISGFDALTDEYGTLPLCVRVSDGFTPSVLVTLRDYMQTPEQTMLVTRPVYHGEIPLELTQYEPAIREMLYPFSIIIITVFSLSLCFLFSRRNSPEKESGSSPAKILHYLETNLPSSQQQIVSALTLSRGSVRYQLRRLKAEGKIFSIEINGRQFYSLQKIPLDKIAQAVILAHENELEWKICRLLVSENRGLTRAEITESVGAKQDTVYYHLNKMGEILQKRKSGGVDMYQMRDEAMASFLNLSSAHHTF